MKIDPRICKVTSDHVIHTSTPLLYPRSPNLCMETVVDSVVSLGYSFSVHA